MSNRKRLEEAGMLEPGYKLTRAQSDALESLTTQEVEILISARNKLSKAFRSPGTRGIIGPPKRAIIGPPGRKGGGGKKHPRKRTAQAAASKKTKSASKKKR